MSKAKVKPEACCPKFDKTPWDEKTHQWEEKQFIKDSIPQLFHIPLPWTINQTMARMWKGAEEAGAAPDMKDFLMLAYDPSHGNVSIIWQSPKKFRELKIINSAVLF